MKEGYFDASNLAKNGRLDRDSVPDGNGTITHIWVPSTITAIDTWVFRNYTALEEVEFEDGPLPLSIGMMVFQGCSSLVRVSLPGRVSNIGRACFRGCVNLSDFVIGEGDADFTMPLNVFDNCQNKEELCAILEAECNRRHAARPVPVVQTPKRRGKSKTVEITSNEVGNYVLYPYVKEKVQKVEMVPDDVPNGTLFVCVDRTWGEAKCDEKTGQRISLEDCARGYWYDVHLRKVRLAECRWLMAIANGRIKGAWKIDLQTGWKPPESIPQLTWPSNVGPWKVPRLGCQFMPDDAETLAVRAACVGKAVSLSFSQNQTARGVFRKK